MEIAYNFVVFFLRIMPFIGLIIIFALWNTHKQKVQTTYLQQEVAPELDLQFFTNYTLNPYLRLFLRHQFSGKGSNQGAEHFFVGDFEGVEVMIFNYFHRHRRDSQDKNHPKTYLNTVFALPMKKQNLPRLPRFTARPKGILDFIKPLFGYQVIELSTAPGLVFTCEEAVAQQLNYSNSLEAVAQKIRQQNYHLYSDKHWFVVCLPNKWLKTKESYENFLRSAIGVYKELAQEWA